MAIKYPLGSIVRVAGVPDQRGANHKTRPIVLVIDFHDTDPVAFGVAITGEFDYPLPASSVSLPYGRHGKCGTGLDKEVVAKCT